MSVTRMHGRPTATPSMSTARRRWRRAGAVLFAAGLVAGIVATSAVPSTARTNSGAQAPTATEAAAPPGGYITNFVKYVDGSPKSANPNLAPVLVGWSSNDTVGTIISQGPEATDAACRSLSTGSTSSRTASTLVHPLKLDKCIILNAEEEGLTCAEKFLNNPKISVISFGALSVGASSIESTVAGKKPIIFGFSNAPTDITTKNLFILGGAAGFGEYEDGTFAQKYLHAKSCAIVFPNQAGAIEEAGYAGLSCKRAGMTAKSVPFDPTTSDLTGALTAAGAQTAGVILPLVSTPSNCLATANAVHQLGISPNKVLWITACQQPSIKAQYPGGDYPQYYSSISQSGDALIMDPTGVAFKKALSAFGHGEDVGDDWYSGMFGQMLTIAEFMNQIGYSKLGPAAILAKVRHWKGPLLLGGPKIDCGEYKFAPGACSDGNYFFKYEGNGKWVRVSSWLHPPPALIQELKSLPFGAPFPTG